MSWRDLVIFAVGCMVGGSIGFVALALMVAADEDREGEELP
jgi:uncharacterized membrane protein YfcA